MTADPQPVDDADLVESADERQKRKNLALEEYLKRNQPEKWNVSQRPPGL
jgi:hypothetical protein